MRKPFSAYRGEDPYVFICYAHQDAKEVFSEISWLNAQGVNVWYDEGVKPGVEWSEALADAIQGCSRFLYFVTPNSVASENCRRELNFAQEEGCDVVAIHLDRTKVPGGLRLNLNNRHAILRFELATEVYRRELIEAAIGDNVLKRTGKIVSAPPRRPSMWIASTVAALALVAAIVWWSGARFVDPTSAAKDAFFTNEVMSNSIAVLPFKNLSPNSEHAYFAAGIHEEILSQLSKIRDLPVIARTTMARYADTEKSIPEIGAELNVSAVMEGSVRYADNRVRIATQLIDAESGTQLWSEVYERNLEDFFAIQLAIASELAKSLKAEFLPTEQERVSSQASRNPQAYARYLLGLSRLSSFSSLEAAHYALDEAIELDPEFASALAFKGWIYQIEALFPQFLGDEFGPVSSSQRMKLAVEYAKKAVSIDENEAFAYLTLAIAKGYLGDKVRTAELQRALALKPNDYRILSSTGANLMAEGEHASGIELMQRSIELNPGDIANIWFYSDNLFKIEMWEFALQQAHNVINAAPEAAFGHAHLARISAMLGDTATAKSSAMKAESLGLDANSAADVARAYGRIGDQVAARRVFELSTSSQRAFQDPYWQFRMHVSMGEIDIAMAYLEEMVEMEFPSRGIADLRRLSTHTLFDEVRDHRSFDDLVLRAQQL